MAIYWGRFVPSVTSGTSPGDWEMFRNAENPARELKRRARDRYGKVFLPPMPGQRRVYPSPTELRAFNGADQSAMMLIWLCRDLPEPDVAPDEVWHLTDRYGLIRTPWSVIIDPIEEVREPSLDNHEADEYSVVDVEVIEAEELWRPPSLDELAERKVILIGDKRPLTAGAFSERAVERFSPTGIRKPCPDCDVVPNAATYKCRC